MLIGREDYENKNTDKWTFREDNDGDQWQTRPFFIELLHSNISMHILQTVLYNS